MVAHSSNPSVQETVDLCGLHRKFWLVRASKWDTPSYPPQKKKNLPQFLFQGQPGLPTELQESQDYRDPVS